MEASNSSARLSGVLLEVEIWKLFGSPFATAVK